MISRENRAPYAPGDTLSEPSRKLSILDLFIILLERKKTFLASMFVICATAVVLTFVLPKYFTAKAVVLPPGGSMQLPFGSMFGGGDQAVSGLLKSFNLLGASSGTDQLLSILDSRRLAETVIAKFDLETHYEFRKPGKEIYPEDVHRAFHRNLKVVENDFGNIEIMVTDKDPALARDMANFIVNQLDSVNYQISKEHAGFSRRFFEERLSVIRSDLDSAQSRFALFKIKNNYLDLETQVKTTVDVLAGIEAERMALDVQVEQLRSRMGMDNQRVRDLMRERDVLGSKVDSFMKKGDGDVLLALKQTPMLGIQYAYLYRDVKVQEALYQFVLQMFEQAKMNEANNIPTVRVLEYADLPHKRSRPKRRIICLLALFAGLSVVSVFILVRKWYDNHREAGSETYRKLDAIRAHLLFKR